MGSLTSRPSAAVSQRRDPVLKRLPFAGETLVTTMVAPSAAGRFAAENRCVVRFGSETATITPQNAAAAVEFARYLAEQATLVIHGRQKLGVAS